MDQGSEGKRQVLQAMAAGAESGKGEQKSCGPVARPVWTDCSGRDPIRDSVQGSNDVKATRQSWSWRQEEGQ